MEDRINELNRQIETYRGLMRKGAYQRQTEEYLQRILAAEEELRQLNKRRASQS